MSNPLVSIVLTSYNQPQLLERAFDSLINQTYKNIEVIIVDDCSNDPVNRKLIEELELSYPDKVTAFFQEKNVGIPANKNTGFRLAKGEYITYLDGDDTYYQNKIKTEVECFLNNPEAGIVYSNFDIKTFAGEIKNIWCETQPPQGYIFKDIVIKNFPCHHYHRYEMFRKEVLTNLHFYDEQFPVYHDLDFMLRYSLEYKVAYNDNAGASYFKNPESIVASRSGIDLINEEMKVFNKHLNEIKSHNLSGYYKTFISNQELNKLIYAEKINYSKLIRTIIKQPLQIFRIMKIVNYVNRKKNRGTIV